MSYNLVDPTTGDLTRVAGNSNIVDTSIGIDSTWSSKKISADLADKQDFRIFNSLEEFNEKKGTSLTVVSGVDNMKDIVNAMSNGEILIIITKYKLGSEVYFGLTKDTGWTKMFTFVKSDGLCDVECRTTFPLTFKRVLNSDGVIGDWQQLATTDSTLKTIQLSGSVDCNTLTEPGLYTASAGAVSALTNAPVNNQVHLDGGFSILVTKTNVDSVYYGMQMFIPYGSDVPFIRKSYYLNGQYWSAWGNIITSNNIGSQTVASANKIKPNYTSVTLTNVTSDTLKYVKIADCNWNYAGTLQVYMGGNNFHDTLVINFGGGNATTPMLCGYYFGNYRQIKSVIAQKGSDERSNYSIYVKVKQVTDLKIDVALLKGYCTINITESTTAPTNISEWAVDYGFFGNITAPNITSLEQRVTALESNFDYTVDSQQKFDNLLSILKSGTPNTYRSIAIIGGLGNGEHGEYLYTVDSNSSDANLNNASLIGLNNPKIVITINNANTNVFKNGLIEDIDFNIGGTVNDGENVTLLYRCTYNNGKIALNNISARFNIVDTTLSNVVNNECKSFLGCTLNDCETIQSSFTNCSSEMLYVSTDTNIANKYSFNKCGIHLDMKKTNMAQLETVTINIASMTDSKLTVLDTSSKLKKIILNVDASDSLSEIVGNNDKKYSIYEPFVKRVSKSVSPSMRNKTYLCIMDESHTPIFSNDGRTFYLDEAMTQQVNCYFTVDSNYKTTYYFTLASDTSILYSSLTLNKQVIDTNEKYPQSIISLKLSDICDEFILNGSSLKTYICMNDTSGTLLYSNDSGTTLYISPYISSDTKLTYIKDMNSDSKVFKLREKQAMYAENLNAFNTYHNFEGYTFVTPRLLEVTALKDNYAVQVVSNYDVPIYVENAFSTKVKNG